MTTKLASTKKVADPVNVIEYFTLKIQEYWRFLFRPVLTVPLIMLGSVWRRRKMLFAGLAGAFAATLLEGAASPLTSRRQPPS